MRCNHAWLFAVLLLVAFLLPLQTANAGPEILGAISGTLWATKDTPVRSYPEQSIMWSGSEQEAKDGESTVKYLSGNILVPVGKYPIFPEMRFMKVDVDAFGIKPQHLKSASTELRRNGRLTLCGSVVVIDCQGLDDSLTYYLVSSVVQNQGRSDDGGLIPLVLQLVGRLKHRQIEATDYAVKSFNVEKIDGWVEAYCKMVLGGVNPVELTTPSADPTLEATRKLNLDAIRAQYYLEKFREKLSFSPAVLGADWYIQGLALQRQGFQAPLSSKPRGDDPETAALKQQNAELKATLTAQSQQPETKIAPEAPKPVSWKLALPEGKIAIQVTRTPLDPVGNFVVSCPRAGYGWSGYYAASSLPGRSSVEVIFSDGSCAIWNVVQVSAGAVIDAPPDFVHSKEVQ